MKTVIFFALILMTFLSVDVMAQESFITGNHDQSKTYSMVGKVTKNTSYSEAWIKVLITDNKSPKNNLAAVQKNKIEIRSNQNLSTEGYDKYLYSLNLYQVDCSGNKIRITEIDDYDTNGKLLGKAKITDNWVDMVEGTIQYSIGKKVCSN